MGRGIEAGEGGGALLDRAGVSHDRLWDSHLSPA